MFLTPSPDLWLGVPCRGKIIHQKLTLGDFFIIISHVWPSCVTVWHHFFHPHIFFQAAAQSWLHPPSWSTESEALGDSSGQPLRMGGATKTELLLGKKYEDEKQYAKL